MTPDEMSKSFGRKKCMVKYLEYQGIPNNFCMMPLKKGKEDAKHVYFTPAYNWQRCIETVSGHLRRRSQKRSYTVRIYLDRKDKYGHNIRRNTVTKFEDAFGPDNPMCMGFSGLSMPAARSAQKVLNLLEKESNTEERTVVKQGTYRINAFTSEYGFGRKSKTKIGPIFIIPTYWQTSIPHLSFYLLIVRICRNLSYKNITTFENWCKAVAKSKKVSPVDKNRLEHLLNICEDLPKMLIKYWKPLKKSIPKNYGAPSHQGISFLIDQIYQYAYGTALDINYSFKTKGETIKNFRIRYIKSIIKAHRGLVSILGPHIKRYNTIKSRKQAKGKKV